MAKKSKQELKEEGESNVSRYRHMCKPQAIYKFLNNILPERAQRHEVRKQLLKKNGFGSLLLICNWTRIPGEFVKFVSENFDSEHCHIRLSKFEALPVTEKDVERVYDLPAGEKVVDTTKCIEKDITDLRRELGLGVLVADVNRVTQKDMLAVIEHIQDNNSWCKAVLIFILGCLLCPDNYDGMTLHYARIIADLGEVASYNWCKHVFQHLQSGTQGLKTSKADLHFFLIHYIERMGPQSPYSHGKCSKPTLQNWDVSTVLGEIDIISKHVGLAGGVTSGYTHRPLKICNPDELLPFDPIAIKLMRLG